MPYEKTLKKFLSLLLILCLTFQSAGNILQVQATGIPKYYGWTNGLPNDPKNNQIYNGCRIYALSMLLTEFGISSATPYNIYNQLMSDYGDFGMRYEIFPKYYNVTINETPLSGSNAIAKNNYIKSVLTSHPEGVVIAGDAHFIYAFLYNGSVRYHDPYEQQYKNVDYNGLGNGVTLNNFYKIRYIPNGTPTPQPTPPTPVTPSFTFENHGTGGSRGWVTETNASVYGIIHTNITSGLECGLKIGTASNAYFKTHTEAVSSAGYNQIKNNGYTEIWYNINDELGVTLTSGTTYYYRFFMKYNGQEYTGPEGTFKTNGPTPEPVYTLTIEDKGVAGPNGWVKDTNANMYSIIRTNIPSGLEYGIRFGTASGSYTKTTSRAVDASQYNSIKNNGYVDVTFNATNSLGLTLTPGTTYYYQFFAKHNGKEYTTKESSFKTTGIAPYFNFENKGVTGTYGWVDDTNASIYALIHTNVTSDLECGITLGQASEKYTKTFTEAVSSAGYNQIKSNGYFEAWYNVNDELAMTLTPDTTYYYKFFVKSNGITHFGNEGTFKTTSSSDSNKFNFENIGVTGNRGWATSRNASVYALIHTNITSGLECGIRIGQTSKQYTKSFTEDVSYAGYAQIQNKGYVEAWYNLKDELGMALSPGATYYYQFFIKYNGNCYYGKEGTFTTPTATNSIVGADNIKSGDVSNDTIPESLWIAGVTDQTYNGQSIKQDFRVYDYKTLLRENIDYSVTYKNNQNVNLTYDTKKDAVIIVTGKGNYSGKATVFYNIEPKDISSSDILVDNLIVNGNNKTQKPIPKLTYKGKSLKNNKDFTVSYPSYGDYKSNGTYEILITGKGNFTGSRTIQFNITNNPLMKKATISKIPSQVYSGSKITPKFTVRLGKALLVEGIDYSVTYKNNIDIGTATAIITALPNSGFAGSKEIKFKIVGTPITKVKVNGLKPKLDFVGINMVQSCTLTYTNSNKEIITLNENKDYTVSYSKNQQAGTASIIFTGINGFYGTLTKKYKISAYDINKDINNLISVQVSNSVYAKGGSKPKPVVKFGNSILTEGTDYTLSYKNNKTVNSENKLPTVIIKGKKNFKGSISLNYTISSQNLSNLSMLVSDVVYKDKSANFELSDVTIFDKNGNRLKKNTDYDADFVYTYATDITLDDGTVCRKGTEIDKNIALPAGSIISVSITGRNNYTGTITGTYQIVYASIASAKVTIPDQEYTGYEITPGKDEITIALGKTLLSNDDFDIIGISNNIEKGKGRITLKGKGNYGGIKTVTFKIKTKVIKWW